MFLLSLSAYAGYVTPDALGGAAGSVILPVGDVDGDGFVDLVVGDGSTLYDGEIYVLRGGAPPDMEAAWTLTDTSGGDFARAVAGGDVDGDGLGDLAVVRYEPRRRGLVVDVYLGSAAGPVHAPDWTLDDGTGLTTYAGAVALEDLDGDGLDEAIYVRSDGTAVDVYTGSATGFAGTPAQSLTFTEVVTGLHVGDLDDDGLPDLIAVSVDADGAERDEGRLWVHRGVAGGFDTTAALDWISGDEDAGCGASLALGDLDGDGVTELAVGCPGHDEATWDEGRVVLFDGDDLTAAPRTVYAGTAEREGAGYTLAPGDLDGDGDTDLAVGGHYMNGVAGSVRVLWNEAGVLTTGAPLEVDGVIAGVGEAIAVADVDGDGVEDLSVTTGSASNGWWGLTWWWAGGADGITLNADPPDTRAWVDIDAVSSVVPADVDGDGLPELIMGYETEDVLLTTRDFTTVATIDGSAAGYGHALIGADLTGDGYDDIVTVSTNGASTGTAWPGALLFVHLGGPDGLDPTPALALQAINEGWGNPLRLGALGDVDGDGFGDFGYADDFYGLGDGMLEVLFGDAAAPGTRTQTVVPDIVGSYGYDIVAAGDVDGDGFDDALISAPSAGSGRVALLRGGPAGLDATPAWTVEGVDPGASLRDPSVGDLDGDGFTDVFVVGPGSREAWLFLGDGVSFETTASWAGTDAWGGALLPDLDGDGDGELGVLRIGAGDAYTYTVYAGTPVGVGGPLHALSMDKLPGDCFSRAFGVDLDGDGVAELVHSCEEARFEVWSGGPDAADADGDGYRSDDCDDTDASVFPGAPESADATDENCDGAEGGDTGDTGELGETGETGDTDVVETGDTDESGPLDSGDTTVDTSESADSDTGAPMEEGCSGCGGGRGVSWAWVLLAGCLGRRRRTS